MLLHDRLWIRLLLAWQPRNQVYAGIIGWESGCCCMTDFESGCCWHEKLGIWLLLTWQTWNQVVVDMTGLELGCCWPGRLRNRLLLGIRLLLVWHVWESSWYWHDRLGISLLLVWQAGNHVVVGMTCWEAGCCYHDKLRNSLLLAYQVVVGMTGWESDCWHDWLGVAGIIGVRIRWKMALALLWYWRLWVVNVHQRFLFKINIWKVAFVKQDVCLVCRVNSKSYCRTLSRFTRSHQY